MRLALHWQILGAMAAAVILGLVQQRYAVPAQLPLLGALDLIGTLFLNALKMLVVPLIATAIVSSIAAAGGTQAGDDASLGRLGAFTVLYYTLTGALAVATGIVAATWLQPGRAQGEGVAAQLGVGEAVALPAQLGQAQAGDLAQIFLQLVPANLIAAAADGQLLGVITFAILCGVFIRRLPAPSAEVQRRFWQSAYELMMALTDFIIRFAPLGVFALLVPIVADTGLQAARPLAWFMLTVCAALAFHTFVTLSVLLAALGGRNPLRHLKDVAPALLTAFSTASSAATLPLTLEVVEERAKVSPRTSNLVLPVGATVNMDGTALFECVTVLFLAQAYGIELSFVQQFLVLGMALVSSVGVAGIPAASFVAITIILGMVGLPLEAVALVLGVDRVLDMARTATNVYSDTTAAVILDRFVAGAGR